MGGNVPIGNEIPTPGNNTGIPRTGTAARGMPGTPGAMNPNGGGSSGLGANYDLYNKSVEQNAEDYSGIMQGYKDQLASGPNSATTEALANIGGLAKSGGYSDGDIASLRERGISPIRSIYSSANRDVDRQRALQGGFSPNYGAVKAKMAREMSDSMSNQMNNVNAGIAEKVASNKMSMAPTWFNAASADKDQKLKSLSGMTNLYGTTPALSQLFGNQAMEAARLQHSINQSGTQTGLSAIRSIFG